MPWIVFTEEADTGFGTLGEALWLRADASVGTVIPQPEDICILARRGSGVNYQGRLYVVDQYTDNILIDEHMRMHRMGIDAPALKPVLASGGGGPITGMVGTHIGYISFYDSITGERSSLSAASEPFSNAGANAITWTQIPTSSVSTRVDYIEFWRSVDGGAIRFAGRRTLGVTTFTEQTATLALGEVAPDFFERFPPMRCNAMYHDRLCMAGDKEAPDTLYLSALFFPERFEGLTFKTRNGEPIVGLINVRDMLLVLCPNSSYILQGYSEDDMVFSLSEPDLGALNHHGLKLVHGNAIIPNNKSIYLFNGSWHNLMKDGMEEWRSLVDTHSEDFALGFGNYDPVRDVYKFTVSGIDFILGDYYGPPAITLSWVADMKPATPQLEGTFNPPNWSFDARNRTDFCSAVLALPGWSRPQLVTGSLSDGRIRKENAEDNFDDDEDQYLKTFTIMTGGYLLGDPGGNAEDGKTLKRLWTYLESEFNNWEMRVVGGDEKAYGAFSNADFLWNTYVTHREVIPFSATSGEIQIGPDLYTFIGTAKTVHVHGPERVSGRCFFLLVSVASPNHVTFRGFGFTYGPGPIARPSKDFGVDGG